MMDIKNKIEAGSSMSQAFRNHPKHFDQLYCNLVAAGEASGTIDAILERLGHLQGKDPCHQGQDQVGPLLSDLGHHGRDRGGVDHHGVGHPGVQEGVRRTSAPTCPAPP